MRRIATLLAALLLAVLPAACNDDGGGGGDGGGAQALTATATSQTAPEGPAATGTTLADLPDVVASVRPSVVTVLVTGAQGEGAGSGVIWSSDGIIVTNNHVVEGAQDVRVALASGERLDAEVQATDPRSDLAILRVDREDLPAATFAERTPEVGAPAIAIGSPLGFESTVTAGIVSGLNRSIPTGGRTPALVGLLQTDAPISPGNSGGALIGADGRVIGINVAYIPPPAGAVSLGFAIPSSVVRDVVEELLADGTVEHAYLGVALEELTPAIAESLPVDVREGAIVLTVQAGSPAAEAGIRPGDIIVAVGGEPVRSVEDVLAALRNREPGDRLEVRIVRDGDERSLTVPLGELAEQDLAGPPGR